MLNKSIVLSLLCNLFHYYAFSIYAFSSVILAPLFFPENHIELKKFIGLITLSVILLLKPVGSIIFGHIGDKYGRKISLTCSLIAINAATTGIGLIPSYASIGYLSSISLIMCLLIQGICMGGQYTGAIIFIQEHTKKQNASFACGTMVGIGVFGTLLGTSTSFLFYSLKGLEWGWRLPFFFTFIIGVVLYYLMQHMEETPVFITNKPHKQKESIPFLGILKNYKRTLCASIFISSIPVSMFYLATVYLPNFYGRNNHMGDAAHSLFLVCFAQVICMILIPFFGYIADRVGKENQLKTTSLLLIIIPMFLFYFMGAFNNSYMLLIGISVLSLFASLYSGPAPALLSEKFPVIGRYSGMGIGISIGEGLFGGLSPLICVGLEQIFGSAMAPASFIMFLGAISFLGIILLKRKKNTSFQDKQTYAFEINPIT